MGHISMSPRRQYSDTFHESGRWSSIAGSLAAGEPDSRRVSLDLDGRLPAGVESAPIASATEPSMHSNGRVGNGHDQGDVRVSLNDWGRQAHASRHGDGWREGDDRRASQHSIRSVSSNASNSGAQSSTLEARYDALWWGVM